MDADFKFLLKRMDDGFAEIKQDNRREFEKIYSLFRKEMTKKVDPLIAREQRIMGGYTVIKVFLGTAGINAIMTVLLHRLIS